MNRYLLSFILCLWASCACAAPPGVVIGALCTTLAGSGECTLGPTVVTYNDYRLMSGHTSAAQGINSPGAAIQLCALSVTLQHNDIDEIYHVELWTTPDYSGQKVGENSVNFVVSDDDNAGTIYHVTWISWPTVSMQYYLHIVPTDWGNTMVSWKSNTDETSYGSGAATDNANRDGADLGDDYVFSVSYLQ